MRYNKFGDTGVEISALGFGCMRFPMLKNPDGKDIIDLDKTTEMILKAYEKGVNYFDTAYMYCNDLSEDALGKVVSGFRDKIYISTKSPVWNIKAKGDYFRILEEQLKKLNTDYVDFYHFHGIGYDRFIELDKSFDLIKDALKAKEQGLIKNISFSFHGQAGDIEKLVDIGIFGSLLAQYNVLDRSNENGLAYAKSKGVGTVVMGPLGGGRISGIPKEVADKFKVEVKSSVELGLRFIFANKNIDCALSGMGNIDMVEENADIASNSSPITEEEYKGINAMLKENEEFAKLYCTGCEYCLPCPKEVRIPYIFQQMNLARIYKLVDYAKNAYNGIGANDWSKGSKADKCIECGKCEAKCPQKIKIIEQLKECHAALS